MYKVTHETSVSFQAGPPVWSELSRNRFIVDLPAARLCQHSDSLSEERPRLQDGVEREEGQEHSLLRKLYDQDEEPVLL